KASTEAIHRDVLITDLASQSPSKTNNTGFRSRIVQSERRSSINSSGPNIDYLSISLGLHCRVHRSAAQEHASEVTRHHPVPSVKVNFRPRLSWQDAHLSAVFNVPVDAPPLAHGGRCHRLGGDGIGNICGGSHRVASPATYRPHHFFDRFWIEVRDSHARARL